MTTERINEIAAGIVDTAFHIHRNIGPGLFESVYEALLSDGLKRRGLHVKSQVVVPLIINDRTFDHGFRADLIVENAIIVEVKSLDQLLPVHSKKLLTYLRLTDRRLGLLINFGAALIKDGIKRVVNHLDESEDHAKAQRGEAGLLHQVRR